MEDKFNIDDSIVLNPKGNRANNIKKILSAFAVLVVLFLIILIIMRFINNGSMEETDANLEFPTEEPMINNSEILEQPKKVVINTEPKKVVIQNTQPRSSIQQISSEKKDEEKGSSTTDSTMASKPKIADDNTKKQEIVVVSSNKQQITQKKEEVKKEVSKIETIKPKIDAKQDIKPVQKPKNSKPEKKIVKKEIKHEPKKGILLKTPITKGNYIQVLAVSKFKPDEVYIKKLTTAGYNYKLYDIHVSGKKFTKILVGPYDDKTLQKELSNIRAKINKNAFRYIIK